MRRAMGSLVLLVGMLPIATPALAQAPIEVDTLTLTATPTVALGGTITLTATLTRTLGGISEPASGFTITLTEEARLGCNCGVSFGSAPANANGQATFTVPATSPPLIAPAVGTHTFVAEAPGTLSDATARATTTVVCPAGQTPDVTGNACVAAYPLAVAGPRPAAPAAPQVALASKARSHFPLGVLGVAFAVLLVQASLWVLVVRRRAPA